MPSTDGKVGVKIGVSIPLLPYGHIDIAGLECHMNSKRSMKSIQSFKLGLDHGYLQMGIALTSLLNDVRQRIDADGSYRLSKRIIS